MGPSEQRQNQESLTSCGGLKDVIGARAMGGQGHMAAGVCPEVPTQTQRQVSIHKLLKFMLLFGSVQSIGFKVREIR